MFRNLKKQQLINVKAAVIKQVFSSNGNAEKAGHILAALHEEGVRPESEEDVAKFWLSPEVLAKVMPSLVCPATLEPYSDPAICVARESKQAYLHMRDRVDSVVYQEKFLDGKEPYQSIHNIIAIISYLKESDFYFTYPRKPNPAFKGLSQGLLSGGSAEFFMDYLDREMECQALGIFNTPASECINLAAEMKYWLLKARKAGKPNIDLAKIVADYPYPLRLKKPSRLTTQIIRKCLA